MAGDSYHGRRGDADVNLSWFNHETHFLINLQIRCFAQQPAQHCEGCDCHTSSTVLLNGAKLLDMWLPWRKLSAFGDIAGSIAMDADHGRGVLGDMCVADGRCCCGTVAG